MRPIQHSVRLPIALDKELRQLAERTGMSVYAALQASVLVGIEAQNTSSSQQTEFSEMIAELAFLSTRLTEYERILDRVLFTTCAAYAYARSGASGVRKSDDIITSEINEAYDRQRRLSQEHDT